MTTARWFRRAFVVIGTGLAVLLWAAPAAHAHGGEGQMEVTSITRDGDEVTVAVHLIAVDDGHGLPDATVTVVVGEATPVPMEPGAQDGDYQVTVVASEGAPIRVTSVEPPTTAEATAPPMVEETTSTVTTTAPETTTTAETSPTTTPEQQAADPIDDQEVDAGTDERQVRPSVVGAAIAVVVALVAMGVILLGRKRDPDGVANT